MPKHKAFSIHERRRFGKGPHGRFEESHSGRFQPTHTGYNSTMFIRMRFGLLLFVALAAGGAVRAQVPDDALALWAQATLYRDEWGVPHVYGQTPRALGFAFGYAQAEDHCEAMLMAFRTANGRAAEVVGEKMAKSDEFSLRLGHARLAEQAFALLDETTTELCTGFAMGVNTWLLEHQDIAPWWADGVKPSDPLALWRAFVFSMAPLDLPGIERPAAAMDTGNAWALAAERTEEGKALLVINPHNYFEGPFRWYEAHLSIGGVSVAGATLFGLPVIVQGHNDALGWALTPNFPDTADVFQEVHQGSGRAANDPRVAATDELMQEMPMLEYFSQAQPYFVRTDAGLEERAAPGMMGPRGPVFEEGGALYSWTVGGAEDFGAFSQLATMASARNLGAFQDALAMQQIPCFNVVYADREGNVFYLYNAKAGTRNVPLLDDGSGTQEPLNWARPVNSGYHALAWGEGIVPAALPSVANPASGFVQACGGPPWVCTDDAPLDPGAYPAWFFGEGDTFRAQRVRQLLRTGTRTFRDMQAMLYDTVAPAAAEMTPILLAMAEGANDRVEMSHPDLVTGLELLRDWDHSAEATAKGMTFYHVWWSMLKARHAAAFPGEGAMYRALAAKDNAAKDAALAAAADAARLMRNDLDTIEIPWGEAHRVLRGAKDYAMPGAVTGEPIFVASDHEYGGGKWRATYGYGVAMAIEFGEEPEAVSVSTFGASENPMSPHYSDQLDLLLNKRFKRTRFTDRDVFRYSAYGYGRDVTLYPLGAEGAVGFACGVPTRCALNASPDAPAPLPAGLAAFTVFVTPSLSLPEALVELAVSLAVPAEVCTDEDVEKLALYAQAGGEDWQRVDAQRDDSGRVLSASGSALATFAILGPETALINPEPLPVVVPKAIGEGLASDTPAEEPAPQAPGESSAERAGRGMKLRLKGSYVSEQRELPQDIEASDRGVRVIRLRGSDFDDPANADAISGSKGSAFWMEGLPTALPDAAEGAQEQAPATEAPQATFEPEPAGMTPLPSRLRAEPAITPPMEEAEPAQFAPDGGPATAPVAPEAEPGQLEPARELSRKEKKRKKKAEAEALPEFQEISVVAPGREPTAPVMEALPAAPPDSFGDAPPQDDGKKKKGRRNREGKN